MKLGRRAAGAAIIVVAIVIAAAWRTRHREDHRAAGSGDPASPQAHDGFRLAGAGWLPAGRHLAGMVLLGDAPAPGAIVHAVRAHGAVELPRVVAGPGGRFDLGLLPADRYLVIAEKPQAAGTSLLVDLRDPTVKSEQLALVLHACEASIHGVVRDIAGGPVGGARVARSQDSILWGEGTETDASGNYELCTVRQDVSLVAWADGYTLESATVKVSGRIAQDFMLSPEGEIAGQVVRAADRAPVPDAVVIANPEIDPMAPLLYAVSDQDGRFRFVGAHVGRYLLTARAAGLVTRRTVPVVAQIGAPEDDIVCELAATTSLAGQVVEGSKGIAGAQITLEERGRFRTDLEAVTQADGSFWFDHLEPGDYVAKVFGYDMKDDAPAIHVDAADVSGVKIEVTSRASISGRVTHAGKPVEGADVRVGYQHVVTDADGRYEVRGLEAGTYYVYGESTRLGVFSPGPRVDLGAHDRKTGVDVELDLAGSISGKVIDQEGAPAIGVLVSFSLLHGRDFGAATTAEDGSFTAGGLSGGGAYTYEVRAGYDADITYPPADRKRFPSVAVADGKTRVTGVTIRIRRQLAVIAGRVVSTGGEPVPDAIVRADLGGGSPTMVHMEASVAATRTDQNGAFRLDDVVPGTYVLRALTTHGEQTLRDVSAGRRDVVIRIPEPGAITGTLEGFTDPPEIVATLQEQPFTSFHGVVRGNTFAIRGIPPGKYGIRATSTSGNGLASAEVAEHGSTTVLLRSLGFGTIAGTVVDAKTHKPLAGLGCQFGMWSKRVFTDGAGRFQIDHVAAGDVDVFCSGPDHMRAYDTITVTGEQTAKVELLASSYTVEEVTKKGHTGFTLEQQFSETLVASVERGGPAERAGLRVGDVLTTMNGAPITTLYTEDVESLPAGTSITFGVERDDKPQTVTLTLGPVP